MSDWWVRAHWGRAFEILHIEPQIHNMSWAVMRKRDVPITTGDIEQPSDDPREFSALKHSLRQAQANAFELAVRNQRLEQALRAEYEESLSWRVTAPLRRAVLLARTLRERRTAR
jgi:hypothetical protein